MGTVHARVSGPAAVGRDTRVCTRDKGSGAGAGAAWACHGSGAGDGGDLPKVTQRSSPGGPHSTRLHRTAAGQKGLSEDKPRTSCLADLFENFSDYY